MAEDFKSRLAAIEAAKADRIKKQEDEKMNAEIGEAQEEAGKENILRDRAHVLETEVVVGLKEAEGQMQDVNNALAKEDNDPEATAAYEGMKVEIQQKIDEINTTGQELSGIKAQIEMLNVKPVKDNVEAPKDLGLSEAENKFNTQKEGFYKKVNETLEKMPDLNTASGIKDADEKVSAVMDEFNDLIENVHGPRAGEVLKDLYEKIGPNALEFVKQLEKMRNKPKNKTDKYGQKNEVYNLKSVIELSRLGDRIDDLDHAAGADCAQYVLEQYVDKFSGKSPKDIRKGLFDPHNNKALYKSLHLK